MAAGITQLRRRRRKLIAGCVAVSALALASVGGGNASAQEGLVDYHCTDPENPFGYEAKVETSTGVVPASVPVGGTAQLSNISVGVHFVGTAEATFSNTKATLTATIAPGGTVAFGQRDVDPQAIVISDGGSAQVVAQGTPGQTLNVALSSFHVDGHFPISGSSYTLDCSPVGAPATVASILLTEPNTPPGPAVVQPATPILSQIRYAG